MPLTVLHINQSDISGGAAIAAYRLHRALRAQGVHSRLLAGVVKTDDPHVAATPPISLPEKQVSFITRRIGLNYIQLISSWKILRHPFYQEAAILNFHNLHTDYFNYLAIPALTQQKASLLTLHDMWSFTGHCGYSYDCTRWQTGCGNCPFPHEHPPIQRDATQQEWKLKHWAYARSKLSIVAPSTWLAKLAGQSMLRNFKIHHIPNGIDVTRYKPLEPEKCRDLLGISPKKRVLMFVAHSLNALRKGGDLFSQALHKLPQRLKSEILLLMIGYGGETLASELGIPTVNLGYVGSDQLKAIVYSAADLFLFPTRADNLPVVLQESMACGTPMVSFHVGGVPDLVRPGVTGYLASPCDVDDFCAGIIQLLEDKKLREHLGTQCRKIAEAEYPATLQAQRYNAVYQALLQAE
ncbi:glycosyl transferase [candidate division KSB3 bacterium]|uniref:Glycosyl transferase n=1 Tax=candidate division KSB3 bacterium TaxID=2044937 RepID=A0A2G6E6W2_9BACT|nr:MAG: glycosyl transferase [candidate division KSB3 bacterium]PIE30252.1 MAG: glycosyl transferase [candidate division KSB3 bacterium]